MTDTNKTSGNFDFIIVGGGSAGAVMAARLSESGTKNVLLIEAGKRYEAWDYPLHIASADKPGGDTAHNWGYCSQPNAGYKMMELPRGKVLGGSSAINGAVALRARSEDLKKWDLPGWSYSDMLPYYKKLETSDSGNEEHRGFKGPIPTRQLLRSDLTAMQNAFVDSALSIGYKAVDDFDGPEANGVGPYRMNVVNGVRVNTGMAYLTNEVRRRENLTILPYVIVDRVLFDGANAEGVVLGNGKKFNAKEIILSAGTYGTAAILLRSGIGAKSELENLAIPVVADLPVGQHIKDHPFYNVPFAAYSENVTEKSPIIGTKLWTSATGTKDELDLHIIAAHTFPDDQSPTGSGFVLSASVTKPISRGKVWIDTKDPNAAPKIDLNFLGNTEDVNRMVEAVKIIRRIASAAPLSNFIHSEIAPGGTVQSDEMLAETIKANVESYAHPVGSAPMGATDGGHAVVDLQGKVYRVNGLRVADASIFPDIISVATNITVIATAEKIADQIITSDFTNAPTFE